MEKLGKDILGLIFKELKNNDIYNVCIVSKKIDREINKNKTFWYWVIYRDFGFMRNDLKNIHDVKKYYLDLCEYKDDYKEQHILLNNQAKRKLRFIKNKLNNRQFINNMKCLGVHYEISKCNICKNYSMTNPLYSCESCENSSYNGDFYYRLGFK